MGVTSHNGFAVKLEKSYLQGEIARPPASKSYTHRAIFAASLANGKSTIENILYSRDTQASILVGRALGAEIRKEGDRLEIIGKENAAFEENEIYAANSGTTLRFAMSLAAIGTLKVGMIADSSLSKRPLDQLITALGDNGAYIEYELMKWEKDGKTMFREVAPVRIHGPIHFGDFHVNGKSSSQFPSSLLMAMPLIRDGAKLTIHKELVSKPYVDITTTVMEEFGIKFRIFERYRHYEVKGQKYLPTNFTVPTDYSAVALLVSAAILLGKNEGVTINVSGDELPQGDKEFLGMVEQLGAKIKTSNGKIEIAPIKVLEGGSFDLSNTPDLLPPLAIASIKSGQEVEIKNVAHARLKETDRIAALATELRKIGVEVNERNDGMIIRSRQDLKSANLKSYDDHRLFMGLSIAGMYVGNSTIDGANSVNVSYPNFVAQINGVGGKIMPLIRG